MPSPPDRSLPLFELRLMMRSIAAHIEERETIDRFEWTDGNEHNPAVFLGAMQASPPKLAARRALVWRNFHWLFETTWKALQSARQMRDDERTRDAATSLAALFEDLHQDFTPFQECFCGAAGGGKPFNRGRQRLADLLQRADTKLLPSLLLSAAKLSSAAPPQTRGRKFTDEQLNDVRQAVADAGKTPSRKQIVAALKNNRGSGMRDETINACLDKLEDSGQIRPIASRRRRA